MTLDPDAYERAARYIEENGWWDGRQPDAFGTACISNAVSYADNCETAITSIALQDHLADFLGQSDLGGVFTLNDSQSAETGAEWAITTLRAIAEKLRADEGVV